MAKGGHTVAASGLFGLQWPAMINTSSQGLQTCLLHADHQLASARVVSQLL